jgi:uncharacterized protein (DUF1015 family)
MKINAFRAIRPTAELADKVASVPYDTINREEAKKLAENNPFSFLRIIRAEIELADEVDIHSDEVYKHSAANLNKFLENGTLVTEDEPSFYIYRQIMDGHSQSGIVCCCHIDDYENNIIRKHEKVLTAKVEDRTHLIKELNANTGPIFLTYRDNADIDKLVMAEELTEPLFDFTSEDAVKHTVWKVSDCELLYRCLEEVPLAYIADGHHRAASAVAVGQERKAANPEHNGDEEYNWFVSVLFPATQLKVLPYNRCVHDLNGMTAEDFLDVVKSRFNFDLQHTAEPPERGSVSMYLDGEWYSFRWGGKNDMLDADVLQDQLLAPLLDIEDPKTDKRISFIGGIRGTEELERLVDSGDFAVAFSMYPVAIEQVMAVSDDGQVMPPKSTWFEPKLRSGLFIHSLID